MGDDEKGSGGGKRGCGCVSLGCGGLAALMVLGVCAVGSVPAGFRGWAAARETEVASEVAPNGRYVRADDVAIFLQEHGPEDGPPVVLIHGTGAWSGTWRDTQKSLAKAGYRVIAIDLPPFGFSQRPDPPRYDRPKQGQRILGVVQALGYDSVTLVGHSFGGGPTLEAALMRPDLVRRLILVDAAISLDSAGADPGLAGVVAETPWLREAAVAATFTNPLATHQAVVSMIHDPADASEDRIALYQQPFAVRGTTAAIGEWLPELVAPNPAAFSLQPDRLSAFDRPVTLIWGREDTITPPDQARHLAELFPDARVVWLDGVGHIPQIEDPPALNKALKRALKPSTDR